ncbi:uncharacterized protein LOC132561192 [Ylistrum balloti]|uniref:uncharacterized protein LOC132561192 n=1 Tax=Ylistrum balloti TaxID=509963 RepID=UPI002905F11A|nr:uncharacterized protein LOC132561192 [Ylistrum balloti]
MAGRLLLSRSVNTGTKYYGAFAKWEHFISGHGFSSIPANPIHVALYLNSLLEKGGTYAVVSSAVYAIKWVHNLNGHIDPTTNSFVQNLIEFSKREAKNPVCKKEPVTTDILINLCGMFLNENDLLVVRDLAMILLGFSGFLRFNELSSLRCSDVQFFEGHLTLNIRKSKTDKYRFGSQVVISKGSTVACPYTMLSRYVELSKIDLSSDHFLFKQVYRSGQGCKLINKNKPLSYTGARQAVMKRLKLVSNDTNFGLHSLRAGGATVAANNGVNDRCFRRHGRWKGESSKDGYVADSLESRLLVTQKLGL